MTYFTVVIPFEKDPHKRTVWHPTDMTGPFAVLTRGAFTLARNAHAWALTHLGHNATYTVKRCA